MKCPRCERELEEVVVEGVQVDACHRGCGGIWFDAFELEKMDEPEESAGWLLENLVLDLGVSVDYAEQINCPRCAGIRLMRQAYPKNRHIATDKCPSCGGVWLDFGELFQIRLSNRSPEEVAELRSAAADLLGYLKG